MVANSKASTCIMLLMMVYHRSSHRWLCRDLSSGKQPPITAPLTRPTGMTASYMDPCWIDCCARKGNQMELRLLNPVTCRRVSINAYRTQGKWLFMMFVVTARVTWRWSHMLLYLDIFKKCIRITFKLQHPWHTVNTTIFDHGCKLQAPRAYEASASCGGGILFIILKPDWLVCILSFATAGPSFYYPPQPSMIIRQ